jgi:hypothetical protein
MFYNIKRYNFRIIVIFIIVLLILPVTNYTILTNAELNQSKIKNTSNEITPSTNQSNSQSSVLSGFNSLWGGLFTGAIGGAIITGIVTMISKILEEKNAERKARRDYEYNALIRLYKEYEPLIFQLHELSDSALIRIRNLARAERDGILKPRLEGAQEEGDYYINSTIYRVLAPMVVFKLMARRLTIFDLNLNPYFKIQYNLAKILYLVFSKDITIANMLSENDYYPSVESKKSRKQGIVIGIMDNMLENLIEYDCHDKIYRMISFGEFEKRLSNIEYADYFKEIFKLFKNLNPKKDSILWTIILIQVLIHKILLYTTEKRSDIDDSLFDKLLKQEKDSLDLRTEEEKSKGITNDNYSNVAKEFIRDQLKSIS